MRAAAANPALRPTALAQIDRLQAATAARIAQTYIAEGTPATFRVIVDPLVTWIWIGGLIALTGAAIALWPARRSRRDLVGEGDPELEALKEAKYREIRDAELDHAAGKLSDGTSRCSTPSCAGRRSRSSIAATAAATAPSRPAPPSAPRSSAAPRRS